MYRSGDYRYELVPDAVQLPTGWTVGQTAIATDSADRPARLFRTTITSGAPRQRSCLSLAVTLYVNQDLKGQHLLRFDFLLNGGNRAAETHHSSLRGDAAVRGHGQPSSSPAKSGE